MRGGKGKKEQTLSAYLKNVKTCTKGMKIKSEQTTEELIRTDAIVDHTAKVRAMKSELRQRIRRTTHLEWKTSRR